MKYILDMVHENPGEAPFKTDFRSPSVLADLGYNGQVFKHLNTIMTFDALGLDCFPQGSEAGDWLDKNTKRIEGEIRAAKEAGLKIHYHLDLFVLPKQLVESLKDEICDPETGKISLKREKTLEVHQVLFDEMFQRFPEVDGVIIRVGETYLYDTPFHTGNGAVPCEASQMSDAEKEQFVILLNFLRENICVRHRRDVIFRTWDCHPTRFHASKDIYLELTNQVEPHEQLLFSIKHTALDFWRWVDFNPCLTVGKHEQIVEVQCQREYEGKGAYPSYVMNDLINGFVEHGEGQSLSSIQNHPLIQGLYTWSRGGGWYGPYIPNEFWPRLNTYVISHWFNAPQRSEESIFLQFARAEMGLSDEDATKFRQCALMASEANLKGHYCESFDTQRNLFSLPSNNWMRDDHLGGLDQLKPVFEYLYKTNGFDQALREKQESVQIWNKVAAIFAEIKFRDSDLQSFITSSIEYGKALFTLVAAGWEVMALGYINRMGSDVKNDKLITALEDYDKAYQSYQSVFTYPLASTLYKDDYWSMPEHPRNPGLADSVREIRHSLTQV